MKNIRVPNGLKFLWLLSLWLLIVVVVLIAAQPSTGYEPSLYTAVPLVTWLIIGFCVLSGLWSAIWAATDSNLSKTNVWAIGAGLVLAVSVVIILAPLLRGYSGYGRSDIMIHAGRVNDILFYGRVPEYERSSSLLLYPASLVILAEISLITGLESFVLIQFTTLFIFLLGFLFTYLLAKVIFTHPLPLAVCTLASSVLLLSSFNYQVMPTVVGITLFPLVLWLYLQAIVYRSVAYRISFILVTMTYAFIHPLTCINLLGGLIATELYRAVSTSRVSVERARFQWRSSYITAAFIGTVFIIFITLATWLIHNWFFWALTIRQLVRLMTFLGEGAYAQSVAHLGGVQLNLFDVALLLVKMEGHHALYISLTIIGSIIIAKKALNPQYDVPARQSMIVVVFIVSQAVILVGVLFGGSGTVSYWRSLAPIVLLSPIVLGYLGYHLYLKYVSRSGLNSARLIFFKILVTLVLGVAFGLGIISFFPSPITYRLNEQISAAELEGMNWFIQHRDENIAVDSVTLKYMFPAALVNYKTVDRQLNPNHPKWGETLEFPDHFDYTVERKPAETFPLYYLPLNKYDQLYYTLIPRNPPRLWPEDFERLNELSYMNKLYTNGELEIWLVYSPRQAIPNQK